MSVIAPTRSSAQRTCTRMPVLTSSGEATSSACRNGRVAPSRVTSAKANGRSNGWPFTGSGTHVHDVTVPDGRDLDEVGGRLVGDRVVLQRGHDDLARRRTAGDDDAVAQAGEEPSDDGSGGAGVVERYGDRC